MADVDFSNPSIIPEDDPKKSFDRPEASEDKIPTWGQTAVDSLYGLRSGLYKGAHIVPGLPGDISSLAKTVVRKGVSYPESLIRGVPRAQVERELIEREKAAETGIPSLPTSSQIMGASGRNIPYSKDMMEYKPKTTPGRYAKTVGEALPAAVIPGGGVSLGVRTAGGIGAGLAQQGLTEYRGGRKPETWGETAADITASLAGYGVGTLAGHATSKLLYPIKNAEKMALERVAKNVRQDVPPGSLERRELTKAAPPTIAEISGPKSAAVKFFPRTEEFVEKWNKNVSNSLANINDDMASYIAQRAGRTLPEGERIRLSNEINKLTDLRFAVNDPNYKKVMSLPEAQSIPASLALSEKLVKENPLFRNNIKNIDDIIASKPERFGIIVPDQSKGQSGNLRYWDAVKKEFDSLANNGKTPGERESFQGIAEQIRNNLDKVVPSYKSTRDAAAEVFGYQNALELGADYILAGTSGKYGKSLAPLERNIGKISPRELERLQIGAASALQSMMVSDPTKFTNFYKKIDTPEMRARLANVFKSKEAADEIIARAQINSLYSKAVMLPPVPEGAKIGLMESIKSSPSTLGGIIGGFAATGAKALVGVEAFNHPFFYALSIATGAGYGVLKNRKDTQVARHIAELMTTPEGSKNVANYIVNDGHARRVMGNINQALSRKVREVQEQASRVQRGSAGLARPIAVPLSQAAEEPRPLTIRGQRQAPATGGRIERQAGGRVSPEAHADRLIAAAELAKRRLVEETKPLLNEDDNTIAKALEVANRQI